MSKSQQSHSKKAAPVSALHHARTVRVARGVRRTLAHCAHRDSAQTPCDSESSSATHWLCAVRCIVQDHCVDCSDRRTAHSCPLRCAALRCPAIENGRACGVIAEARRRLDDAAPRPLAAVFSPRLCACNRLESAGLERDPAQRRGRRVDPAIRRVADSFVARGCASSL